MGYFILGIVFGGLIGVVIMACCAAAGFANEVDRWVEGEKE